MKKIALPIGILIFFSMSYSQPKIEFGIKTTRFMMEDILMFYGGTWNIDVLYEYYWGVSGELLIGFTKNLYIRFEMFGIKKFDRGGVGINVLSDLNADLIFVLPIGRSFSPLVYCGFSYGRFWDMPMNDCRGIDPAYELRVGLGAQYQLQKKIKLFLETEIYTKYQSQYRRVPLEDMVYSIYGDALGVNRINFGARLGL